MDSSITTNGLPELTPAFLTTLEECSEESVFAPGYIQPYGLLLTLAEAQLTIQQVSENVKHFFDLTPEDLLGQPLRRLFSHNQVKQIKTLLQEQPNESCSSFELRTYSRKSHANQRRKLQLFRGTLHRSPQSIILELEPLQPTKCNCVLQTYHHFQSVIVALRGAHNFLNLAQILAQEVKVMTGFDRVMIYRFETDEHGVVIAEAKEDHLESYLGLHYPATDIPVPARRLFSHNWVRQIPDINYVPAPILSPTPEAESPLDLRSCLLRGVSPYHVEYLQNMGVAASFTVSLMDGKRLWGLIACHHYSPRLLNYETRKTCEFIGQFASIELIHQQDREANTYRTQVKDIQDNLQRTFLQDPNFIEQVLIQQQQQLLNLVHAQGAAVLLNGSLTLIGNTPSEDEIWGVMSWLKQYNDGQFQNERVFATDALPQLYPPAKQFKDKASGLLGLSIVLSQVDQKSYHILWFRPEQIYTVNWAGNPQGAITTDELGKMRLCPRKSFELWKETVREKSYPWQAAELEAADEMRNTLMLAVLEFSQAALEQAAERAAIANRAKSQFLAKMSHELRTPLNAILGFTQVMNRSPNIPTEFQEHLGIINRSGEHLLTLINDVLEMSRIEAGQLVLIESCFDLSRLIRSLQDMFALKASQKGILLTIEQAPTLPHYVCGDEAKLRQILINLLSNAIKFTSEGEVTLKVTRGVDELPSNANDGSRVTTVQKSLHPPKSQISLRFSVMDTGCGIATSDMESIFEAFMQTDQGRHVTGTGLGLSISRQFAQLMGGDITVDSAVNQGSTFTYQTTFYLPDSLASVKSESSYVVVGLEPGQPQYCILVAEDVRENQQLMLTLLESIGFEVKIARTGVEAIALWQSWKPHLIFMDIEMPDLDGHSATRHIRLQEAQAQRQPTPIIALSACAFDSDRINSLEVGCNEHIAKPFTEAAIFEAIAHHLSVRYIYKERESQEPISVRRVLTPQDLKIMPSEWIEQVHEAALDLNDAKIYQLIAIIPHHNDTLIKSLNTLVDNFQLETIAVLTQP